MKVFYCECQGSYAGGLLMVAADTIEEAILIAVKDKETSCYFSACNYYGYRMTLEGVTIEDVTTGVELQTYKSAKDAMEETNISRKNIGMVCLGKRATAGGYIWKFK